MSVATEILGPALRLAGVVTGAGRTGSASELAEAFQSLNRMLEGWNLQRNLIYTVQTARYPLTPSQTSYTLGPGGDFDAPRPIRIEAASIVLTGSTSEVHIPLVLLTDRDWAQTRLREVPTTVPTKLYADGAFPLTRLYLWGYPTAGNDLELFTWNQLGSFAAQTDAATFPPGYLDAITYNLAARLCAQFGTALRPDVVAGAREGRALVKGANSPSPRIASADFGAAGKSGGGFNYLTGTDR